MKAWPRRFFYGLLFCAPIGLLGTRLWRGENALFVPGRTSDGHHQIENECSLCHDPFGGAKDDACLACHGPSLKARDDSHAPAKFDDPARAAQLALVDARSCVGCHREHRAEARLRGSVTVPSTFCIGCHAEIRQERPNHAEFSDSGCASAGCHNYHDNRALYRDFLAKDRGSPGLRADPRVPTRTALAGLAPRTEPSLVPAPDLPASLRHGSQLGQLWEDRRTSRAGRATSCQPSRNGRTRRMRAGGSTAPPVISSADRVRPVLPAAAPPGAGQSTTPRAPAATGTNVWDSAPANMACASPPGSARCPRPWPGRP